MSPIDPRLVKLYDEYNRKEDLFSFAIMLYQILRMIDEKIRNKARAWMRKHGVPGAAASAEERQAYFYSMSPEEHIEYINKPYQDMTDEEKRLVPNMVKSPEQNNYARIYGLVDIKQRQKEFTAARLVRYMESHGFTYSDEHGEHLDYKRFCKVSNEIAVKFDLKPKNGKVGQYIRIHPFNMREYTQRRVTPKGDKLSLLAAVTNLPLWYLSGYMSENHIYDDKIYGNPLRPFRKK